VRFCSVLDDHTPRHLAKRFSHLLISAPSPPTIESVPNQAPQCQFSLLDERPYLLFLRRPLRFRQVVARN
jgi:hypothetical protein